MLIILGILITEFSVSNESQIYVNFINYKVAVYSRVKIFHTSWVCLKLQIGCKMKQVT